eukprot:TRINITY_DN4553_c0_g2_i1.p1 TRINITY_DN4553_c0_g2~~TRINITY_DN4553_c0_g2_i1.p1  ORF type:complete len:192 (+),score=13.12 TRINITY_DN4553_c0_g2_i1:129-704(+)
MKKPLAKRIIITTKDSLSKCNSGKLSIVKESSIQDPKLCALFEIYMPHKKCIDRQNRVSIRVINSRTAAKTEASKTGLANSNLRNSMYKSVRTTSSTRPTKEKEEQLASLLQKDTEKHLSKSKLKETITHETVSGDKKFSSTLYSSIKRVASKSFNDNFVNRSFIHDKSKINSRPTTVSYTHLTLPTICSV